MAKSEMRPSEKSPSEVTPRGPQERGLWRTGHPAGISAADFFRMGPFHLMRRMNEEVARMFGEVSGGEGARNVFAPPIEVMERNGKYVVRAELPGVDMKDISLKVTDDAVVIEGEHHAEHEEERAGVHLSECRYGHFYRAIPLPEGSSADQANAHFDNGVLEIEVPVTQPKTQARQIPIQSTQASGGQTNVPKSPGSGEKAA